MREVVMATPNRQQIETGHREFDRAVGAIRPGNVVDGAYHASYVRPFHTAGSVADNPGGLQAYDLEIFDRHGLPKRVRDFVCSEAVTEAVLLSEIRHMSARRDRDGERVKVCHGYIVTASHDAEQPYELLATFVTGPTRKSERVVAVCAEYLSNPRLQRSKTPIVTQRAGRPSPLALGNMVERSASVAAPMVSV